MKTILSLPFLFVGIVAGFIYASFIAGVMFGMDVVDKIADEYCK